MALPPYRALFEESLPRFKWTDSKLGAGFEIPYYPHPLMSPFFTASRRPDIDAIEALYARLGRRLRSIILENAAAPTNGLHAPFLKRRYKGERLFVCRFIAPATLRIPEGYTLEVGGYAERRLLTPGRELTLACFRGTEAIGSILRRNAKLIGDRRFLARTYTVNVRHRSGALAATGNVSCSRSLGWLFAACVAPAHRRRGLWGAVTAARRLVAASLGARDCRLLTQNGHLSRKADSVTHLTAFTRDGG